MVAGVGWQAPRPANMTVIKIQLNKDRLENMASLPSPMRKLLFAHSSHNESTRLVMVPDKCLASLAKLLAV